MLSEASQNNWNSPEKKYRLTTKEFAAQLLVRPQTVRKQYCATGSYFGVVPLRLPNRKLLWPANTVQKLLTAQGHVVCALAVGQAIEGEVHAN